jgi:antitoxin PrlF
MKPWLKEESTITAKGQTTVPKSVRQALGVDYGGRIAFVVDDERRVYVQKADNAETEDPVIAGFLAFLAQDMARHPEKSIVAFPKDLLDRAAALTEGMVVDLDAGIEGDVSI